MFAVVVTFQLHPGKRDAFMPLVHENAAASLRTEQGCRQFDVATDPAHPNEVFLYELYTDADAFAAHMQTPHFGAFDAAVADMIHSKDVKTYSQVTQ